MQIISPNGILYISISFADLSDELTIMRAIIKSKIKKAVPPINKYLGILFSFYSSFKSKTTSFT